MKIKMIDTAEGSTDGIRVLRFEAGQTYFFGDTEGEQFLAGVILSEKWGEEVAESAPTVEAAAKTMVESVLSKMQDAINAQAEEAPGHTDLMLDPEQIDAALETNPLPTLDRDPLDHDGDGFKGGSLPKSKRKPKA